MRYKIDVLIVVALICAATAGTAFAWGDRGPGGRCGRDHRGRFEAMAKELNLTPDQEARLKEAKETHRAQIEKLRLALKEKRKALRDELSKPGVTRQSVEPLVAEIKAMEAGLTDQRIQGIFAVKEILTPEQFARLQAGKEARHKKGRKNHCRKGW